MRDEKMKREAPVSSDLFILHPSSLILSKVMRRPERVADILREEISQIVGYELEDPRLTMVTVTDVRLSENLKAAKVYFTVAGNEEEHRMALSALNRAAPYVRKQLGMSLNLPRTPEIHFVRDRIEEQGERVDKLLDKIERDWAVERKDEG
jgi:ribosome-binding factor A